MEQTDNIAVMLDQMPDPAFLVKDGIITQVNPSAARLLIQAGDPATQLLATGAQEYAQFQGGHLALTLNIGSQPCNASVTRINDLDLFVLNHENDQAELQSMALAAQELRNPLSITMSVADQLFPLMAEQNDPDTLAKIAKINRGLYQILRIVGNMSDAYRYSQNTATRFETRDICAVIDELITGSIPLINHTGIELHYQSPSQPIFCLVDSEKLERAVHNIISNALKFTPVGGAIEAKLTRNKNMLYLTVQNCSADISQLAPANFYRQYLRQPGLDDSRFGIGLGMVLIHAAATAHGGTVLLEKTSQGGTRITMSIALRQSTDSDVRTSIINVDYAGERDHRLLELSDSLSADLYGINQI